MERWLETGFDQVKEALRLDAEYQKLVADCARAAECYEEVVGKLTEEEQRIIEDYIALCEEVEYQWTYTAYRCGRLKR